MSAAPAKEQELKARIHELEKEAGVIHIESLTSGYDQCLEDMQNVIGITLETTRVLGPAEGLTYLLRRLQEKDVIIPSPLGTPHDWLSRWKVELAP